MIKLPMGSGGENLNNKHTFSTILMALMDADYKFVYINVGCYIRVSDRGVFEGSTLQQALGRSSMFPDPAPCPRDVRLTSYYTMLHACQICKYILTILPYQSVVSCARFTTSPCHLLLSSAALFSW